MIRTRTAADGSIRYLVTLGHSPQRTFRRKKDAEEYEAELIRSRQRHRAGLEAPKPVINYAQLVELWRANFSPSPWREAMVQYSLDKWGKAPLHTIQPERLGAWIASVQSKSGRTLSEKTRSHILETMRQVLNAGVEWGYLAKSPARPGAFKTPRKNSRVQEIQPFESWDDVVRVADACAQLNPIAGPFVRFACATGLRCPGEIVRLRWEDLDLKEKSVRVGSKTAAGHRTVPLSKQALTALDELPRSIFGFVFPGKQRGKPFDYQNWRDTDWRLALETCGLPRRTPYEMRHTFATLALSAPIPASIDDVATVMGHDDIAVTFRYYRKWIRASADRLRLTLDQIGTDDGALHTRHGR